MRTGTTEASGQPEGSLGPQTTPHVVSLVDPELWQNRTHLEGGSNKGIMCC